MPLTSDVRRYNIDELHPTDISQDVRSIQLIFPDPQSMFVTFIAKSHLMNKVFFILLLVCCVQTHAADYKVEEIEFSSHNIKLSGSIVFPEKNRLRAAVVFVHGSGKQTRNLRLANLFASHGIAAFVYDKRGAGRSGGEYEGNQSMSEHNVSLLADDAAAALNALRQHPRAAGLPVGLTGISQAGWIVPLAAEKSRNADFLVLWSSPVCKVSEEDIYSKHTADKDAKNLPTYAQALAARTQKYIWPDFLGKDTDPGESLARLSIPSLWIFGENDGSIPVDLSIQRLKKLSELNGTFDYVLFSNMGHNNMSETFLTAVDWIGRVKKSTY